MKKELEKRIFDEFPSFFRGREDAMRSLMGFGFSCDDGWFDIIYNLCKDIKKTAIDASEYPDPVFFVLQVKEKFGGLRFYVSGATNEIRNLITKAEHQSFDTCELCGNEGVLMIRGCWYKTLCEKCVKGDYKGYKEVEEETNDDEETETTKE